MSRKEPFPMQHETRSGQPFVRKADLLLIAVLVLAAAAAFLVPQLLHRGDGTLTAELIENGKVVKVIDLNAVEEPYTIPLQSGSHPAAVIAVEPGCIYYLHADCPDQVCVRTGKLTRPGQTAACVPGGTAIRLSGSADDAPDVVAY